MTPLESNCEWVSEVRQFLHHQKDNALTMLTMIYGLPEMMTVIFNM